MQLHFKKQIFSLWIATVVLAGLLYTTNISHAQILYSHEFEQGVVYTEGTHQYDNWITFRESLPESGITGIVLFGSNDPLGRSCNDSEAAQQIADGLRNFKPADNPIDTIVAEAECGGFLWRVVNCSDLPNGVMIRALDESDNTGVCSCGATYALGPAIFDGDWGGIDGPICSAQTQVISLSILRASSSVPTISEWGLIAMAGLLGIIGFIVIRKKQLIVKS